MPIRETPPGVESENYTINASVTDQTTDKTGYASASITVNKVGPAVHRGRPESVGADRQRGRHDHTQRPVHGPGRSSARTPSRSTGATDRRSTDSRTSSLGQIVASPNTPGLYTYSASHQYLDNPPGELTGGSYPITVSVSDGANTTSAATSIVVNNVPPTVLITSAVDLTDGTITATANVSDPGYLDVESVAWTLTQNGVVIGTDSEHWHEFYVPDSQPAGRAGCERDCDRQRPCFRHRQRATGGHLSDGCLGRDQLDRDHRLDGRQSRRNDVDLRPGRGGRAGRRARTSWSMPRPRPTRSS